MKQIVITSTLLALIAGSLGCKPRGPAGPGAFPPLPVVSVLARTEPVVEKLSLVGTFLPDEAVTIQAEVDGTVAEAHFSDGDKVEKGQLLLVLDERKLEAAAARAEANHKLSATAFERAKQLFESTTVSQQEFDQAAAAFRANEAEWELRKQELRDARIHAPFSGTMGPRLISPGQVISKNTLIGRLVRVHPLKVEFHVPERFLRELKAGQRVELKVAAFPQETFEGEVYFIDPEIDPNLRTALVRARLPNPQSRLKPGMFAGLELTLKVRERAVVVPETALIPQADKTFVYVVDAESKAQLRPVTAGVRMNGIIEIVSGLKEGERVIVEGHQKTRPGGPVQLSTNSATVQGGANQSETPSRGPAQ